MLEKLLAKRHIRDLELNSVRAKLMEKLGWSSEQAQCVEEDYKRFLYALAHKRKEDVLSPPTQEVDEFWHQHILDTRKYRADCDTIFGYYLDHTPGLSPEKQRQADARRRQVYLDHKIDSMAFNAKDARHSDDRGGFEVGFADADASDGHSAHGSHGCHDAAGNHASEAGGGHGCDSGHGGDGGGGDGGGGGCGGGGCGGG